MKVAVDSDNKKLFAASEYLTPQQVMSQFSQMSAKKEVADKTNSTDENDNEDEYNWAEREENEVNERNGFVPSTCWRTFKKIIINELQHKKNPI
jgi:hypothetical protein